MCQANPKIFGTWKKTLLPVSWLVDHCSSTVLAMVVQAAHDRKAPGVCAWTSVCGKWTLKPIEVQGANLC